jgi:hypothetical protein
VGEIWSVALTGEQNEPFQCRREEKETNFNSVLFNPQNLFFKSLFSPASKQDPHSTHTFFGLFPLSIFSDKFKHK